MTIDIAHSARSDCLYLKLAFLIFGTAICGRPYYLSDVIRATGDWA